MRDKMVRCSEAASMLGLKESTVRRMLLRGDLPRIKVSRRAVRIPLEAVRLIMECGFNPRRAPEAPAPGIGEEL